MVCFKKRNTIKNKKQKIIMADQQKIHPVVDVEAPPTVPLVPQGSAMSEKGTTSTQQQHPPLQQPNKDGYCSFSFCKCVCWTISVLVLLLIIIAGIVGIVYLVFQPKLPKYSVESLRISDLRLNFDLSLYARFDVKVTANNPNKKIGIYYEKGGRLSVWYTKTKLCQGSLPKFYQGHQNITKLDVALTGQTQYGNTLMNALQEQQQTGQIPLDLKVEAPVAIKLGKLKLMKVRILGECLLVVDSLTTNNVISIKASNCRFKLKL
ncbi:hypothetical protein LWI29_026877 [Acer saccharum]|uniref:Late embryogenesis abundant protein LEA-2 subgroup domain-containing protein n=1 Tax=Acer saccharum TaxID=4024 RepID=A0AA39SDG1_ACESA|nr:hypothetical protein LWI29_026877 [Acer saccharum]